MKKAVSVKNIGLVLGYIVLFVPILFSIFYSVPSVDDFAMALGRENAPGFWTELFSNTAYFFTNRGGTIIACGASSMAEAFSSSSTQASILYNTSTASEAGTTLAIKDMDGNVLLSWDVPLSFTSALISCPQMQVGESYQVVIGDNAEDITIEEVSASYGDAQNNMFGGDMNWGGRH